MVAATETKISRMMDRVRVLLARADHPNTPPAEAEVARERAERLMAEHRIEEASLTDSERAEQGVQVTDMEWLVAPMASEFRRDYHSLAMSVGRHIGAKFHSDIVKREVDGLTEYWYTMHVFGYEADLRFGALLLNSILGGFGERLEPKVDRTMSDQDNVYRMRSAGMERNRIAAILWNADMKDGSAHGKVTRLFKAACEERGEGTTGKTGKDVNAKTYRMSYAQGFRNETDMRLWRMSQAGKDGALVMASREQEILDKFWTAYPQYMPKPIIGETQASKPCEKCEKAKSGYCREHAWRRPSRARHSGRSLNATASASGRDAAQAVSLTGNALSR